MKIYDSLKYVWKRRIGIAFTLLALLFLFTAYISSKEILTGTKQVQTITGTHFENRFILEISQ
ncbi:MAG: hypothetical protein NTX05_09045 [Fusobacteria bacterium]|nr:hypothetical protein [Fusobacteriota bacterium]